MKILVIEDNESVLSMIEMFFIKEGFTGTYERNGKLGYELALSERWDCIILDWMLPEMDGMMICKSLRDKGISTPIIMLTAKDAESDQVLGLELGADDYVTKPFSPLTLMARIKAVVRRTIKGGAGEKIIRDVMVVVEEGSREVTANGNRVSHLTPKEFELLVFLMKHEKQVFTREQLLEKVWGYDFYGDDRTVDVHMKRLRTKLGEEASECLQTIWGVGYKFENVPMGEQEE